MLPIKISPKDQEPYEKAKNEEQYSTANDLADRWMAIVMRRI